MPLTSRNNERVRQKSITIPTYANHLFSVFFVFAKIPFVKRYISNSIGGLQGRIVRCFDDKDYKKAAEIAIHALRRYRHKKSKLFSYLDIDHHHWWVFMKLAVDAARMTDSKEFHSEIVTLASEGIEPFIGYDVAYSYLIFSGWAFESGDYERAIEWAETASNADDTWAEPDYLLGWYNLRRNNDEAESHFIRAIKKDPRILFKIEEDGLCKKHPQLIDALKRKYSAQVLEQDPEDKTNHI